MPEARSTSRKPNEREPASSPRRSANQPASSAVRGSAREPIAALPPDFAASLDDFVEALRVEAGLARNTTAAYRSDLVQFLGWLVERDVRRFDAVRAEDVVDYLAARREEGMSEATVARNLVAVRMLMRHLFQESKLARDPTALIAAPVLRRALPRTLSVDEVERLLASPSGGTWRDQRDRALLELLYASGARVSEATGMTTDALEPRLRVVRLVGKGGKVRLVPLGERAREAISAWIAEGRASLPGALRSTLVFLGKNGKPFTRTQAWRRVKELALRAGIATDVSPHTLRHSFATHMVEGGADLRSVQEMLGHASIGTTEIYTHLDADHVQSVHRLYHPRA